MRAITPSRSSVTAFGRRAVRGPACGFITHAATPLGESAHEFPRSLCWYPGSGQQGASSRCEQKTPKRLLLFPSFYPLSLCCHGLALQLDPVLSEDLVPSGFHPPRWCVWVLTSAMPVTTQLRAICVVADPSPVWHCGNPRAIRERTDSVVYSRIAP